MKPLNPIEQILYDTVQITMNLALAVTIMAICFLAIYGVIAIFKGGCM